MWVPEDMPYLRDFLYLDTEKAASIFSQLWGGLVEGTRETSEDARARRGGVALNLGVVRPEFGGENSERTAVIESRVLHHALFLEIEDELFRLGAAVDVNAAFPSGPGSAEEVGDALGTAAYVRVEGWATIEDYDRISAILGDWKGLVAFINHSAMSSLEDSDEYKAIMATVEAAKAEARGLSDNKQRNRQLRELGEQEKELERTLRAAVEQAEDLDPELSRGHPAFVFLPGRITFRVYPFDQAPEFQVFGNVKRESFVDADLGNLLFAYGVRPNIPLTLFGLVSSRPSAGGDTFDPLAEFDESAPTETVASETEPDDAELDESAPTQTVAADTQPDGQGVPDDPVAFERGFRGVFRGLEAMEGLMRFSRYPNLTVYPIAVYRRVAVADEPAE